MTDKQPTSPVQDQNYSDASRDQQRDYLNHLRTNYTESSILLDKLIVTLAAGAIGVSLTLIDNIAAAVSKAAVWNLVAAWAFLGLSLFIVLISHVLSIKAHREAIAHTQEKLAGQNVTAPSPDPTDRNTGIANIAAIATLAIGLFFLLQFFSFCLYRVAPTTHHVQYISNRLKHR